MAKKEIIKKIMLKKKKKKWYALYAPAMFNNDEIGETFVFEPNEAFGKVLKINLADLSGDIKKQNVLISFLATKIQDQRVVCDTVGYELALSYVKRVIKRAKSKIEDSFLCSTKDDVKVKIKPVILTRNKVRNSILTVLRQKSREYFANNIKKYSYDELFSNIISGGMQKALKDELKKTYPISLVELRILSRQK